MNLLIISMILINVFCISLFLFYISKKSSDYNNYLEFEKDLLNLIYKEYFQIILNIRNIRPEVTNYIKSLIRNGSYEDTTISYLNKINEELIKKTSINLEKYSDIALKSFCMIIINRMNKSYIKRNFNYYHNKNYFFDYVYNKLLIEQVNIDKIVFEYQFVKFKKDYNNTGQSEEILVSMWVIFLENAIKEYVMNKIYPHRK